MHAFSRPPKMQLFGNSDKAFETTQVHSFANCPDVNTSHLQRMKEVPRTTNAVSTRCFEP
jgi:hypothetical protein